MMNRRGFLGTLMASLGVLTVDPAALLWRPAPEAIALPPVSAEALLTLNQITMAVTKRIAQRVNGTFVDGSKIGHGPLTRQINVTSIMPAEVGRDGLEHRYIAPAAEVLIDALKRHNVNAFGRMELPRGVEQACGVVHRDSGVAVRGIVHYDVNHGEHLMRFDVLCGRA